MLELTLYGAKGKKDAPRLDRRPNNAGRSVKRKLSSAFKNQQCLRLAAKKATKSASKNEENQRAFSLVVVAWFTLCACARHPRSRGESSRRERLETALGVARPLNRPGFSAALLLGSQANLQWSAQLRHGLRHGDIWVRSIEHERTAMLLHNSGNKSTFIAQLHCCTSCWITDGSNPTLLVALTSQKNES